jgi:AbrB family looped-hinge helix DNA binding protein
MIEVRGRVNENGRIVLPAAFRESLGIKTGDEIVLRLEDNEIRIASLRGQVDHVRKIVQRYIKPGTRLSRELIRERRRAARDE